MSSGAWHPDPTGRHQLRWWDGQEWTSKVHDDGVTSDESETAATPSASATCGACGSALTAGDLFCGSCGAATGSASPAVQPSETIVAQETPTPSPTAPVAPTAPAPPGPPPAPPPPLAPGSPPSPPPTGSAPTSATAVVDPTAPDGPKPPLPLILGGAAAALTIVVILLVVLLGRGGDDVVVGPVTTPPPITPPPVTAPVVTAPPVTAPDETVPPVTEPEPTPPPVTDPPPPPPPPPTQPPVTDPPITTPPPPSQGFREISGRIDEATGSFLAIDVDLDAGDAMRFRVEPGPDLDTELLVIVDQATALRFLEVVWPVIPPDMRPDDIDEFLEMIRQDSSTDLNLGDARSTFEGMIVIDGSDDGWEGVFDSGFFVAVTPGRYTVLAQAWSGEGDARLMTEVSSGRFDLARDLDRYLNEPWLFAEGDPWFEEDAFFFDDRPYRP